MLATYPADLGQVDRDKLTRCIEECIACAQACTACADASLSEGMVGDLTKCIRTDMDCADICNATAAVLSRHTGYDANITRAILTACATACKACADECSAHADVHPVGEEDTEGQYAKGQYTRQPGRHAGPRYTPGRPSRNHAVILTARRR
jgi:hypothetical protein